VSTEGTDVIVAGAAKISRGPVLVVSTYQGAVELRSGDQSMTVPALREATVGAGGSLAGPLAALTYDAEDLWDRRFLSDSIELGRELEARSKGFSAQLGADEGRTVEFLLQLLPALGNQPDFTPALFAPGRAPGESLVGAAIALEGTRGTFGERWAGVFGFRDAGAQWGLVALDQGVGRVPVLGAVDAAIGRGPRAFETIPLPGPSTTPGEGVALPGPIGGGTGPGSTPTTVARPPSTQNPPVSVPTTAPPATTIGPLNTGIPALDAAVNALVETLTGLLRSLGGS
jgi:hypothetical protein